jgi:hypothetical protein
VAYRWWERSGGGSGEVRGSLAVTLRGGSPVVVAEVGLAACVGLVSGACFGLLTAVGLNQSARGASREVSGAIGARN